MQAVLKRCFVAKRGEVGLVFSGTAVDGGGDTLPKLAVIGKICFICSEVEGIFPGRDGQGAALPCVVFGDLLIIEQKVVVGQY